jgi:hypothetical protein
VQLLLSRQTHVSCHAQLALGVKITRTLCWAGAGVAGEGGIGGAPWPPNPVKIASMHTKVTRPTRSIATNHTADHGVSRRGQIPVSWLV